MIEKGVIRARVKREGGEYILELLRPSLMVDAHIPLTGKQKNIYDFVVAFMKKNMYPPTYAEIKDGLNIANIGSIFRALEGLRKKGYIYKDKGTPRSIWPIELQGPKIKG